MKIVLVNTAIGSKLWLSVGFIAPPYWAAILAAKIRERSHEVSLLDLQFQRSGQMNIPEKYYKDVDAVFVSGMLSCYPQMMEVSKFYKDKGIKVIFGGWGPTSIYAEAVYNKNRKINLNEHIFKFCDAAIIGEAEYIVTEVLKDLEKGTLRKDKIYNSQSLDWDWVMPDFTIWTEKYAFGAIQTQRGCPHNCKFCSVTSILGCKVRAKPVDFVLKEIKLLLDTHHYDMIFFYDDNIIAKDNGKYAKELFTQFAKQFPKTSWISQCTTLIINREDILDVLEKSRCVVLAFGFENLLQDSLAEVTRKNFNRMTDKEREEKYRELISQLKRHGIETWGCFIYGFEHDREDIFRHTVKFALDAGILIYQSTILTPCPGTPLFREMEKKLIYPVKPENWGKYDLLQPVMKNQSRYMDNQTIFSGWKYGNKKFYSNANVLGRMLRSRIPKSYLRNLGKTVVKSFFMWLAKPFTSRKEI